MKLAAEGVDAQTLRQKDRIWTGLWKADGALCALIGAEEAIPARSAGESFRRYNRGAWSRKPALRAALCAFVLLRAANINKTEVCAMDRKTPLYERHEQLGGKIVPFAGYLLPVQYQGVIAEHNAVRTAAGLFDVSHMGEAMLTGPDALKNLNLWLTNDYTDLEDGRVRYSPMCNERGGVVDDLLVYRYNSQKYLIVINASNRFKDVEWMQAHLVGDAKLTDISDGCAEIALQGPASRDIMKALEPELKLPAKYYSFIPEATVCGVRCLISRTGYTGEAGYELYCATGDAVKLWDALLEGGREFGLVPCGLGARDTLRLEAGMPLYGHEMDDDISPRETGLGSFVKMDKPDFIGRQAMIERGEPKVTRVGLKMIGRGIAREHLPVFRDGVQVGHTTSGTHCPFINYAAAMALVDLSCAEVGTVLEVEVRGRRIQCEVVPLPFYSRVKKKKAE